jgi:hypothetical protein
MGNKNATYNRKGEAAMINFTTLLCALFPCAVLFIAVLWLHRYDRKLLLNSEFGIVRKHELNGKPVYEKLKEAA